MITTKDFGAPYGWAESPDAEQVVIDPVSSDPADRGDRVIFLRIEQVDIVALLEVFQRQCLSGQELMEEPQLPRILSGRLALTPARMSFEGTVRNRVSRIARFTPSYLRANSR